MIRRSSIILVCLCGLISAPLALLREQASSPVSETTITGFPGVPCQGAEDTGRKRTVTSIAETQSKCTTKRVVHRKKLPPLKPLVVNTRAFLILLPPKPDQFLASPRAPPMSA